MKTILKRTQVAKIAGVCPKMITHLINTDGFPKPVQVGKSDGFISTEIQEWIDKKIAERDSQGAAA